MEMAPLNTEQTAVIVIIYILCSREKCESEHGKSTDEILNAPQKV